MKYLKSGGLFLILAALTCWLILREYSISQLLTALSRAELRLLLPPLMAMGCFLFCEGLNIRRVLIMLGHDVSIKQSLHYAFTGFFFSSVTPSASGGQPMQLLAMHHDHIPASHGALALLLELTSFQIVSISAALLGLLLGSCRTLALAGQFKYLFILGILLNVGVLLVLLTALFSKSLLRHLLGLCMAFSRWFSHGIFSHGIFRRLSQCLSRKTPRRLSRGTAPQPADQPVTQKKDDARKRALLRFAASYLKAARVLKKHPSVAVKLVGTTALQLLAFYSIPYFVYLSLGLSAGLSAGFSPELAAGFSPELSAGFSPELSAGISSGLPVCSWLEITSTEALLYVSVSALPLPGAVGAAEGGFAVLFQSIFPPACMGCAMVLNRIISFYLPLVVSGAVLLCRRSLLAK